MSTSAGDGYRGNPGCFLLASPEKGLMKPMRMHKPDLNPRTQILVASSTADCSPARMQPLDAARGYVRWTQICPLRPQLESISASPSRMELQPSLKSEIIYSILFFVFPSSPLCFEGLLACQQGSHSVRCEVPVSSAAGRAPQTRFTSRSPADPGSPDYRALS